MCDAPVSSAITEVSLGRENMLYLIEQVLQDYDTLGKNTEKGTILYESQRAGS